MNIAELLSVASVSMIESGDTSKNTISASTSNVKEKVKDAVQVNISSQAVKSGTMEALGMLYELYKAKG